MARKPKKPLPFSKILTETMEERNLTLKDIAEACNVSASVVQGWKVGTTPYDLYAVDRLASYLEVSLSYLLFGKESRENQALKEEIFKGVCEVVIKKVIVKKET